jgi:hypothetical protein
LVAARRHERPTDNSTLPSNSTQPDDDGDETEDQPAALKCQQCGTQLTCHGSQVTVPRNWQAIIKETVANDQTKLLSLVAIIPPNGYGCSGGQDCEWFKSCSNGRNDSVPYCGTCLDGYSEAFGTAECIHTSECGNSKSVGSALLGVSFALVYILFKATRPESTSGGIMDAGLFFAQTVDIVLPMSSSVAQVMSVFDLQFGSTGGTSAGVTIDTFFLFFP